MSAIDIHTHAFPDKLACRAVPQLEAAAQWRAALDGRIGSLLKSMDQADIDVSVVCPIATRPEQTEGIFQWCQDIRSDRIEPFPTVHPADPAAGDWLKRFAREGYVGIKLHPMYQEFAADEPRMLKLYAQAAEAGLTVLIHCGLDVAYPPDDDRATPERIRRVLDGVPSLKLIATHLGGWRMWDRSQQQLIGTNCWMETSFTHELPGERAVAMIRAHGVQRVLFGTDSPWADQSIELARLRALGLTQPELSQVLFSNAAALLGV